MSTPYWLLHGGPCGSMENDNVELFDPYSGDSTAINPDGQYYPLYNGQEVNFNYTEPKTNLAGLTSACPQIPTPSTSHSSSPSIYDPSQDDTVVSVSTAFFPGAHSMESDLCFSSSDMVLFYAHSQVILAVSEKAFSSFLSDTLSDEKYHNTVINIPDESAVLNVILHALYNLSCAQNSPALQTLLTAVNRMPFYDICVKKHIVPGTPMYQLLLSQAPLYPIDIYCLSAQHRLEDLAVNTSSHLLSYQLSSITDEMAQKMGAIYLKRLMCLHLGRNATLKNILLIPPPPHPPTKECNFTDQKRLTRAWALVSAYLAWDGRPNLSTTGMQRALSPLTDQLTCDQCHQTLQKRIQDVVVQWASVKRTI